MPLVIRPEQYQAFEAQRLRYFAEEVARTLSPIIADLPAIPLQHSTDQFVFAQLKRAEMHGLTRRNEMMAWTLCAMVHGPDFEQKMPQVRQVIVDQNYDRSVLLTLLAMRGLKREEFAG